MIVEQKFETKNPSKIGFSNHCLTQFELSFEKITRQAYEHSKIKYIFNILHANESYFCCLIIAK